MTTAVTVNTDAITKFITESKGISPKGAVAPKGFDIVSILTILLPSLLQMLQGCMTPNQAAKAICQKSVAYNIAFAHAWSENKKKDQSLTMDKYNYTKDSLAVMCYTHGIAKTEEFIKRALPQKEGNNENPKFNNLG